MTEASRQSTHNKRMRFMKRGARRAVALMIASSMGVAGFSGLRPMTTKADILLNQRKSSSCNAVPPTLSTDRLDTKSQQQGVQPGSPLDMICKDQHEFELAVGHAMDTLRTDYPDILTVRPDFSIYDPNLEVIDPSGVHLHGVNNYKSAFRLLHALVGLFYCPERSGLTFRMCFDKARQNIRIHWNAQVIPKAIFGGYKTTLYADGISVYEISRNSGNITQHRIERLVINDNAIAPENGVFAAMRRVAAKSEVDGIPIFSVEFNCDSDDEECTFYSSSGPSHIAQFQNFAPATRSVLFSRSAKDESLRAQRTAIESSSSSFDGNNNEWGDALEKKNLARKKFGLKPLTPEEFLDLQKEVQELDSQQQQRAAAAATEMAEKKKRETPGFLQKLIGSALENTCETNFDCEYPLACCDYGVKKVCCRNGLGIFDGPPPQSREGQWAEIPVIANPGPNPPDYGSDDPYRY